MRVETAVSVGYGRWRVRLVCGHELTIDASVDPPTHPVTCPACDGGQADPVAPSGE